MKTKQEKIIIGREDLKGKISLRGKTFLGNVVSKNEKRVAIEFVKMTYVKKYERYAEKKTKIHARLTPSMEKVVNIGDFVKVQECRPLSKIIHFVVVEKIRDAELNGGEK